MTKPRYFENLDILRTIAFLLVFWLHGCVHLFNKINLDEHLLLKSIISTGSEGVRIFFVLSGFLITYLLHKEFTETNKINVLNFYMRRILRIWPLYYLVVFLSFAISPLSDMFCLDASWIKAICFLINFEGINQEVVKCLPNHYKVLWSVCIEEQFYLFWPLLCVLLFRFKRLFVLVLFSLITFGFIFKFSSSEWVGYFHTFGNIQYLMIGSLASYLIFSTKVPNIELFFNNTINKYYWYIIYIIGIISFILRYQHNLIGIISNILLPFFYLFLVLQFSFMVSSNFHYFSLFRRLGKYTYGLYVYHFLLIISFKIAFDKLNLSYKNNLIIGLLLSVLSLSASIVLAYISYNFFEKRILKLKSKFP